MHVLMVCARYPPFIGGTEAHVSDVSRRLTEMGHTVTVVTTVPMPSELDVCVENGVSVVRVPARRLWSDVYAPRHLVAQLSAQKPDVVHVQGYHTLVAPIAMWVAKRKHVPYVVSFHSGGHDSRTRELLRPAQRRALRRWLRSADRLVAVSDFERLIFERSLGVESGSIDVIPTGVSEVFAEVDLPAPPDPPLLISTGRLAEYKGHDLVISALPEVRRRVPGTRLRVLGDGGDRPSLEALAEREGVAGAVDFSFVPAADRLGLARELAASSVAAFMSSYESQGISGYEAVATGVRTVIARGTALEELARYPGVELVDRDDRHALVDALVGQLESPRLEGRPDVPTLSTTAARLESLYRSVVGH